MKLLMVTLGTSLVGLRTLWDSFGTIRTPLDEFAISLALLWYTCNCSGALVPLWKKSETALEPLWFPSGTLFMDLDQSDYVLDQRRSPLELLWNIAMTSLARAGTCWVLPWVRHWYVLVPEMAH